MILAVLSQCFVLDNLMCKFAVIFRVNISPLTSLSFGLMLPLLLLVPFSVELSWLSSETIHHSTSLSFMHFLMFNLFLDRAREMKRDRFLHRWQLLQSVVTFVWCGENRKFGFYGDDRRTTTRSFKWDNCFGISFPMIDICRMGLQNY